MSRAKTAHAPALEVGEIEFHGHTLLTVRDGEQVRIAMKPVCEAIGIGWSSQHSRIRSHPIMSKGMVVMTIPTKGGKQRAITLLLQYFNGWLFTLDASRVKTELRERLLHYQTECFDVLANYWQQRNQAHRPTRMLSLLHWLDGKSELDGQGLNLLAMTLGGSLARAEVVRHLLITHRQGVSTVYLSVRAWLEHLHPLVHAPDTAHAALQACQNLGVLHIAEGGPHCGVSLNLAGLQRRIQEHDLLSQLLLQPQQRHVAGGIDTLEMIYPLLRADRPQVYQTQSGLRQLVVMPDTVSNTKQGRDA